MEPSHQEYDINDFLDALLEKGLVLNADLIISVAGIPLLGVNLRAAIAGMETMLEYGMMEAWDKSTREWYAEEFPEKAKAPIFKGEDVILRSFGSIWRSQGVINAWQLGFWYLTNNRLFLWRKEPAEMLFEVHLDKIEKLTLKKEACFREEREELYLQFDCGEIARIHTSDIKEFEKAIKLAVGRDIENELLISPGRMHQNEDEEIVQEKRVWYLFTAQGLLSETWKAGRLCVTKKRLFWVYQMDNQKMFEISFDKVIDLKVSTCHSVPSIKVGEKILTVTYEGGRALFYAKIGELYEIESAMHSSLLKQVCPSILRQT
ncbi:MAG: gas vesicle protein [Candidatus Bathyarchaeia archaeon]|jgi:hypothetical protein